MKTYRKSQNSMFLFGVPTTTLVADIMVCLMLSATSVLAMSVRAAVVRSQGTHSLDQTIWQEMNTGWSNFGNVPVEIDYTSLSGDNLTLQKIEATNADVLILSAPGWYFTYTDVEIDAIIDYVEAGHGIILTYHNFDGNKGRLAHLLGLSESISLGTNTFLDGIQFDLLAPEHPLFVGVSNPYSTGVPYMAWPGPDGTTWPLTTGQAIAETWSVTGPVLRHGMIVTNVGDTYRGLYFPHYIEDKMDGSNQQDMQVFYNGLLWTAVPEPATVLLLGLGGLTLLRKRSNKQEK